MCLCRREIFEIHTRSVRDSGILNLDVNLEELAANTSHFSGAEIAGVVREAVSFSLERKVSDFEMSGFAGSIPIVCISELKLGRVIRGHILCGSTG